MYNKTKSSNVFLFAAFNVIVVRRIFLPEITFRGARQIQLTSYDHDDGEMPIHGGRSLLPFSHGSHACLHGDDCGAEMFFSSYYFLFNVMCYRL